MKLFEISKIKYGTSVSKYIYKKGDNLEEYKTINIINQNDVENYTLDLQNINKLLINENAIKNGLLKKNDIVISLFAPNKMFIFKEEIGEYIASQNFIIIRFNEKMTNKKIETLFFILSKRISFIFKSLSNTFKTVKMLKTNDIKNITIDMDDVDKNESIDLNVKMFNDIITLKNKIKKSSELIQNIMDLILMDDGKVKHGKK